MSIYDSDAISIMRGMAWEEAKGKLQAVVRSYFDANDTKSYFKFQKMINEFISDVENDGLGD